MTRQEAVETLKANYPDKCYESLCEAVDTAIRSLEAWEQYKAEIQKNLITHGQVVEGEYFSEDAENINYGLNKAISIIDKHLKEVEGCQNKKENK